jgi:hypothetical protein
MFLALVDPGPDGGIPAVWCSSDGCFSEDAAIDVVACSIELIDQRYGSRTTTAISSGAEDRFPA